MDPSTPPSTLSVLSPRADDADGAALALALAALARLFAAARRLRGNGDGRGDVRPLPPAPSCRRGRAALR
eukprot:scaffold318043_cov30-Tisochrysis_lutea.AAC.1